MASTGGDGDENANVGEREKGGVLGEGGVRNEKDRAAPCGEWGEGKSNVARFLSLSGKQEREDEFFEGAANGRAIPNRPAFLDENKSSVVIVVGIRAGGSEEGRGSE
jgi:hypothetical protein